MQKSTQSGSSQSIKPSKLLSIPSVQSSIKNSQGISTTISESISSGFTSVIVSPSHTTFPSSSTPCILNLLSVPIGTLTINSSSSGSNSSEMGFIGGWPWSTVRINVTISLWCLSSPKVLESNLASSKSGQDNEISSKLSEYWSSSSEPHA